MLPMLSAKHQVGTGQVSHWLLLLVPPTPLTGLPPRGVDAGVEGVGAGAGAGDGDGVGAGCAIGDACGVGVGVGVGVGGVG